MKILLVGDIHASKYYMNRAMDHADEVGAERVFFLGDFGWTFEQKFLEACDAAADRTGLNVEFIDGNHEDFDFLLSLPADDDGIRRVSDKVLHIPRGTVMELDGHHVLFMGGGVSVDKSWRIPHYDWWPQEEVTSEDYHRAIENAEGKDIHAVFAHDTPVLPRFSNKGPGSYFPTDALNDSAAHMALMKLVALEHQPKRWYHGHHHIRQTTTLSLDYGDLIVDCLDRDESPLRDNVILVDTDDWYAD